MRGMIRPSPLEVFATLVLTVFAASNAPEPIERFVAFEKAPEGYISVRTPTLSALNDGTIVLQVGAKRGKKDAVPADVMQIRSTDGGRTWSTPSVLVTNEVGTANMMPILARDGTLHGVVMRDYRTLEYLRSSDGGKTFSTPRDITGVLQAWKQSPKGLDWHVVAPGPGSGIELSTGRLVVPVWLSTSAEMKHRPSFVMTMYSDDRGDTWHAGDVIANHSEAIVNPSESDIVELPAADGKPARVLINMRNESKARRRLISESADGASGWSMPRFVDDLYEPICQGSMGVVPVVPEDGVSPTSMLVFVAPAGSKDPAERPAAPKHAKRENLTLYASLDGGATWPIKRVIDEKRAAYSDVAVGKDGRIYVAYEAFEDTDTKNFTRGITFVSIDPAWILDAK